MEKSWIPLHTFLFGGGGEMRVIEVGWVSGLPLYNHNLLYLPSLPLWFQLSHLVYRFSPRLRTSSVPTFPLGSLAGEGPEAGEEGPRAAAPVPDVLRQPGLCPGGGPSQGASVLWRALGFPKDPP